MEFQEHSDSLRLSDQVGIVSYWDAIGLYTISFSQPLTIDSYVTMVVQEMPEAFRVRGKKVMFSGYYQKNSQLTAPMIGGQEVFQLTLEKIEMYED